MQRPHSSVKMNSRVTFCCVCSLNKYMECLPYFKLLTFPKSSFIFNIPRLTHKTDKAQYSCSQSCSSKNQTCVPFLSLQRLSQVTSSQLTDYTHKLFGYLYRVDNVDSTFSQLNDSDINYKIPCKMPTRQGLKLQFPNEILPQQQPQPPQQPRKVLACNELFASRARFLIMFLLLLCLAAVWCNILAFNIAIICMHPHRTQNGTISSLELKLAQRSQQEHDPDDPHVIGFFGKQIIWYTPSDKSLLIAAVAVGALAANVPVVWLTNRYGIRMTFGLLGLLSSVVTLLIPVAARLGLHYFLVIRAIQGVAFAANFSVIGSFSSRWTYYKQNGMIVSALVAHFQLAPAITMPVGGMLCTNFGWPSVYYWHGIASFVLFAIFIVAYRNSPNKHPIVSDVELSKISMGKDFVTKSEQRQVPYGKILTTFAVWAIWVAAFGNFMCVNLMFLFSPTFLHAVLGFHVHHTGVTAAFAPLLQFAIKIGCGIASDKIRNVDESIKLKAFNSLAFFGSAACLIALTLMNYEYKLISLAFMAVSSGFLGFTTGGFFKSAPLIARHYASFVTGNVTLSTTITMILVPFGVSVLAPDNTADQWKRIFFATAIILVITNIFFVIFGSATACSWAISQSAMQSKANSTRYSINTKIDNPNPKSTVSNSNQTPNE